MRARPTDHDTAHGAVAASGGKCSMSDLGADLARAYEARVAAADVALTPAAIRAVGMRQNSELVGVESRPVGYPSLLWT